MGQKLKPPATSGVFFQELTVADEGEVGLSCVISISKGD